MVKRSTRSRVAKRRVKTSSPTAIRKKTVANRKNARVVIGRKKFSARVTCKGKVRLTRAGRKSFNAYKRKYKVVCRIGKRRRVRKGARFGTQKYTYNTL